MRLPEKLRLAVGRDGDDHAAPDWVVLDLEGSYPTHRTAGPQALLQRLESFEALTARLERLGRAPWVRGVLVRATGLTAGLATAHAIGQALGRLAERTRVVVYLPQVSMRSLLVAAEVAEVVAPESAEVMVPGFAAEQVFVGAFLGRHGIAFENLRIREYKSALTPYSEDRMDAYAREQLTAYLDSAERSWLAALGRDGQDVPADGEPAPADGGPVGAGVGRHAAGDDGGAAPGDGEPGGWFAADFTNAEQLRQAGLITRVAYDDEIVTPVDQHWGRTLELVKGQLTSRRAARSADGVAVVPVTGAIVSGRSRPTPPMPFLPDPATGSETVVAALRKAERDEETKAIVLFVDSGGGSALASDVIYRAVARCTKPVVAVMGEVAASGGYYVLAAADHVVASPFTITGSIGVVVGKPVLTQFNERHGLNPEAVGRERALFNSPSRGFSDGERAWAEQMMQEVYDRFVDRVATGRRLTAERVDEIGRGRLWSGADARDLGLVDELGDLEAGLAAARRLAGLPADAPVHAVSAGFALPGAPTFGRDAGDTLAGLWPFGQEKVLTWFDRSVRIR
ncbi:S49 family peptidase [Georgenia sp. TF02-10]|uniref:S49 family peptidase n=1 Tax=Georgenia sp. TF02-10 TaxID=2917725 RepID=UPI001FA6C192|nr:S49 family peptidase [Georgenia sp. TF02-10]UNX55092.1 S49 family peptidase [Georgenia sp. TF02-10]